MSAPWLALSFSVFFAWYCRQNMIYNQVFFVLMLCVVLKLRGRYIGAS